MFVDQGIVLHGVGGAAATPAIARRYVERRDDLAAQLGVSAPPVVHVWLYPDVATKRALTQTTSNAHICWLPAATPGNELVPAIHTPFGVDVHELSHAVAAQLGEPPDLLSEGLAVVTSGRWQGEPVSAFGAGLVARGAWIPVRELFDDRRFAAETARGPDSYAEAALVVARIAESWGMGTLLRLYATARTAAAVEDVLGTRLECLDLAITGPPGWGTSAAVGCPALLGL